MNRSSQVKVSVQDHRYTPDAIEALYTRLDAGTRLLPTPPITGPGTSNAPTC
jgi:hypothetical protein